MVGRMRMKKMAQVEMGIRNIKAGFTGDWKVLKEHYISADSILHVAKNQPGAVFFGN